MHCYGRWGTEFGVAKFRRLCPLVLCKGMRRRRRELENEECKVMRSRLFEYAAGKEVPRLNRILKVVDLCIWRTAL